MPRGDLTDGRAGLERFADNAELLLNAPATATLSTRDDLNHPFRHDGSNHTLKLALRCHPWPKPDGQEQASEAGRLRCSSNSVDMPRLGVARRLSNVVSVASSAVTDKGGRRVCTMPMWADPEGQPKG